MEEANAAGRRRRRGGPPHLGPCRRTARGGDAAAARPLRRARPAPGERRKGPAALEGARDQATAADIAGTAGAAQERAETALAAAELAHRAACSAASLQPGDDCPVCGNRFDGLPHDAPTELAEATAARDAAHHTAADATQAEQHAERGLVWVEEKLHRVMAQAAALEQTLAGARTMAAARDDLATATELATAREQAERDVRDGRLVSAARQGEATRRRQSAWTALLTRPDAIAALGPPPLTREQPGRGPESADVWRLPPGPRMLPPRRNTSRRRPTERRRPRAAPHAGGATGPGIIVTDPADPAELPWATCVPRRPTRRRWRG